MSVLLTDQSFQFNMDVQFYRRSCSTEILFAVRDDPIREATAACCWRSTSLGAHANTSVGTVWIYSSGQTSIYD